jgi:hypothetical protein
LNTDDTAKAYPRTSTARDFYRIRPSNHQKEVTMRRVRILILALGLTLVGNLSLHAQSQYPVMEQIAAKVVEKYNTSSCEQLKAAKTQPPNAQKAMMQGRAVQQLRQDPQMRQAFLDRVAGPIANKLFECGMIP